MQSAKCDCGFLWCNRLLFEDLMMTTAKSFPCPRCQQPSQWQDNPARPFCSERCKLIDLGAWASEEYKVELPEQLDDDGQHG